MTVTLGYPVKSEKSLLAQQKELGVPDRCFVYRYTTYLHRGTPFKAVL